MTGGSQLHEESGDDKITFRLPTYLKEQYKEQVDNMSADLEEYVRQRVGEERKSDDLEPLPEPYDRDLALTYRTLCRKRTEKGIVRGTRAKKAVAQALDGVDQDDAYRVLCRLDDRGYVKLVNEIPPSDYFAVYIRPFSRQPGGGVTARGD